MFSVRQLEVEIFWYECKIKELETKLTRKPSTIHQINEYKRAIPHCEVLIAFQ